MEKVMLIPNSDGTCTGGPLDVILIYHNIDAGTFHPVFYEEHPMPGAVLDVGDEVTVRLMSKMHHTVGFATLEEAQENVRTGLSTQIILNDTNVATEHAIPWNGEIGHVWIVQNWRRTGAERNFAEVNSVTGAVTIG